MKKIAFLPFFVCIWLLSACEGPVGPPGPAGPGTEWHTSTYTVRAADWQLDTEGGYFYYEFPDPYVTSNLLKYGAVVGYLVDKEWQSPMPYTVYLLDEVDPNYQYQLQYTYDLVPGYATFILTISDYKVDVTPLPDVSSFRLSMMW